MTCEKRDPMWLNGGQQCGHKAVSKAVNEEGQEEGLFLCDVHTNSFLRKGGIVRRLG